MPGIIRYSSNPAHTATGGIESLNFDATQCGRNSHIIYRLTGAYMVGTAILVAACAGALLLQVGSRTLLRNELQASSVLTRYIERGEAHTFQLDVRGSRTCLPRVLQHEIDVSASARDGGSLYVADSTVLGTERLVIPPSNTGEPSLLTVQAGAMGPQRGYYTLNLQCRAARPGDRALAEAQNLLHLARIADQTADGNERRMAAGKLDTALDIFRQQQDTYGQTQTLKWMGILLQKLGRFEDALQALEEAERLSDPDDLDTAIVLRNLAATASMLSDRQLQGGTVSRAKSMFLASSDRRAQAMAWYYDSITSREDKQPESAVAQGRRSLSIAQALDDKQLVASNATNLAHTLRGLGRYGEAFNYAYQVLRLREEQNDRSGQAAALAAIADTLAATGALESASKYYQRSAEMRADQGDLSAAAKTATVIGNIEFRRRDVSASKRWFQYASALEATLRASSPGTTARAGLSEKLQIPEGRINTLLSRGRSEDIVEAFFETDRAFSRNLLETVPRESDGLAELRREFLQGDSTLVLMALGENSHAWELSRQRFRYIRLPPAESIEPLVRRYQQLVQARSYFRPGERGRDARDRVLSADDELGRVGMELSRKLITPVLGAVRPQRLLVVASGILAKLPLDSLPDPDEPSQPLLSRIEIVVLPSATAALALSRRPVVPSKKLLFIATHANLPFAERERGGIIPLFPGQTTVIGDTEGRSGLLQAAAEHEIIHIAGHGVADYSDPSRSFIETGVSANSANRISVADIHNVRVTSDLVVLNACQTSSGRPYSAQSAISLASAFLKAGARQVVATLWNVDDEASAEIMRVFYRELKLHGRSPASALRLARLSVASQTRWRMPYYWAGYQIFGMERHR